MKSLLIAGITAILPAALAIAGEYPPTSAKSLSTVLTALEAAGLQDITEVDFDDGRWEIEAVRKGLAVQVLVDPRTAQIVHEERDDHFGELPKSLMKLSTVVKQLEDAGYQSITEIDLEGAGLEIDAVRAGTRYELRVDARTGHITSERPRRL